MIAMGLMMGGAGTVDSITNYLLPITAKHFTDNITLIAFMVALNRVFGFLIQPWAAWKSDGYRSRLGRRRPFLLVSWPITLVSLAVLGSLPFVVPPEFHRTVGVVVILFTANLAMQASLDVCYGTGDPMYGDTFVSGDLGRANGVRMVVSQMVGVGMTFIFVPLADRNEFIPYLGAMGFVTLSWLVVLFGLREKMPEHLPPPQRYTPLKPLLELRDKRIACVTMVATAVLVVLAVTEMLLSLFVTETLGLSRTVLGHSVTAGILAGILCSYPVGLLVDRFGPRSVLIVGFLLVMVSEAGFVFWVSDVASLYACLVLFKLSWVVIYIPVVPLMFDGVAEGRKGAVFSAVQMTRAAVTSVATIGAGFLVDVFDNYRLCYVIAGLVCLLGLYGALRLKSGPTVITVAPTAP
jgi:Na+/melibiose symporter-like transporter